MNLDILKSRCRIDEKTGCWEWQQCIQSNGYGRIRINGKTEYVHRVAWRLKHGKAIPKGKDVSPDCGNKRCCNPEHHIARTRRQSVQATKENGRQSAGLRHAARVTAQARAKAKLSLEKARDIRKRIAAGARKDALAIEFGVDVSTIRLIDTNKIWRERSEMALLLMA